MTTPPPNCKTPTTCQDYGRLERCRVCVESFYWEEGMTIEEGDEWREHVLNPKSEPIFVGTILPSGEVVFEGDIGSREDALTQMMVELAEILDKAVVPDNDNT